MLSLRSAAVVTSLSASVGYILGRADNRPNGKSNAAWERNGKNCPTFVGENHRDASQTLEKETDAVSREEAPSWYKLLPVPITVSAASAPLERSSLPSTAASSVLTTPTNRVGEIMRFGYPNLDNVRFYEDYVVSYDRRNRTAHWVFEHIKADHCQMVEGVCREKCNFKEDESVHPFFRASNTDYKGSGYDRGHLAAASNHRHSQKAMEQTFLLCNVAPQVSCVTHAYTCTHLRAHTHTHTHTCMNMCTCTHTCTCAHSHTCTHVCTHTRTQNRERSDKFKSGSYLLLC